MRERAVCHDCDALEGALHELGCDMERCPWCGGQLITCGCVYELLDIDCSPGTYAYERGKRKRRFARKRTIRRPLGRFTVNAPGYWRARSLRDRHGLTEQQEEEWLALLEAKGRIPWIQYPVMCARCGQRWPEFCKVPDEEWERYVEPRIRKGVLCRECYGWIKLLVDRYAWTDWT